MEQREIKFRAWDVENREMLEANHSAILDMPVKYLRDSRFLILMQFTNLKDKNGKEIYEGDIVEWTIFPENEEPKRIRDLVGFGSGCFRIEKRMELLALKESHRELEVIGNIYENPELLK